MSTPETETALPGLLSPASPPQTKAAPASRLSREPELIDPEGRVVFDWGREHRRNTVTRRLDANHAIPSATAIERTDGSARSGLVRNSRRSSGKRTAPSGSLMKKTKA